jgi:N-acyl-D-aspartate/D-glutamate deacylase
MRILSSICLVLAVAAAALAEDVVLVNGSVIDGTGKPRAPANVRIREGKISEMGPFKPMAGETTIDVKGMIVAPGFVDFRSLSPASIKADPLAASLVTQGVTTAVLGSDGTGPYSIEEFMLPFDDKPPALNIAILVGHTTVRRQILGPDFKRAATAEEIKLMSELISDGMTQGAFGIGADLHDEAASFAKTDELMALAKVIAKFGGTFVVKLRDENEKIADSIKETISLARDAKVPVQVLTSNKSALAEIEKARVQRVDISADSYSFPQLAADKTVMIERAVQRMTSTPAGRMGLRERGTLKKGAPADVVVFNPLGLSAGIKYMFVNGAMVIKDGQTTDARSGQALR